MLPSPEKNFPPVLDDGWDPMIIRRVLALRTLLNCLTSLCLLLDSPPGTLIIMRVIKLLCLPPLLRRAMLRPPNAMALLGRSLVGTLSARSLLKALTLILRFNMV